MKKTLASLILLFALLTNLSAAEAPAQIKDSNCTAVKCKTKKSDDKNCTKENCKTKKKSDCAVPCNIKDCTKCTTKTKTHCSRKGKADSNQSMPKWNTKMDENSSMKSSHCSKSKKAEEKPMKCGEGKCGSGKCGGK